MASGDARTAQAIVDDPKRLVLPKKEAALIGLVSILAEAPWSIGRADLERARAAGASNGTMAHSIVLSSFFHYLNRVADAIDIELDYESPLDRMVKHAERPAIDRPPPSAWARPDGAPALSFADFPPAAQPFESWRAYVSERDAPLDRRTRDVLRRAAAYALCDATTVDELAHAAPRNAREERLAAYASTMTAAPWRLTKPALDALREDGLDDRGLLDLISVAAFQNTASRIRLAFAAAA